MSAKVAQIYSQIANNALCPIAQYVKKVTTYYLFRESLYVGKYQIVLLVTTTSKHPIFATDVPNNAESVHPGIIVLFAIINGFKSRGNASISALSKHTKNNGLVRLLIFLSISNPNLWSFWPRNVSNVLLHVKNALKMVVKYAKFPWYCKMVNVSPNVKSVLIREMGNAFHVILLVNCAQ